jgi:hypothetical protein
MAHHIAATTQWKRDGPPTCPRCSTSRSGRSTSASRRPARPARPSARRLGWRPEPTCGRRSRTRSSGTMGMACRTRHPLPRSLWDVPGEKVPWRCRLWSFVPPRENRPAPVHRRDFSHVNLAMANDRKRDLTYVPWSGPPPGPTYSSARRLLVRGEWPRLTRPRHGRSGQDSSLCPTQPRSHAQTAAASRRMHRLPRWLGAANSNRRQGRRRRRST